MQIVKRKREKRNDKEIDSVKQRKEKLNEWDKKGRNVFVPMRKIQKETRNRERHKETRNKERNKNQRSKKMLGIEWKIKKANKQERKYWNEKQDK